LVLTDHVATTPRLLDAIRARAARRPAEFHLLVPNPARAEWHLTEPQRDVKVAEAELALATALALIEAAAGHSAHGTVSVRHDPVDAIEEFLQNEPFDEIILAIAPDDVEGPRDIDLPRRLAHFGILVATVAADVAVPV
jgi:hypothetical protein